MPETKPDLPMGADGVCGACRSYQNRSQVNWRERDEELRAILDRYRNVDGSGYDCMVPSSGGKDSTAQVLRMLQLGMKPLVVTATTDKLSALGRRNIENIKQLGVDYLEYTVNPVVRRKINRVALTQVGDISWPEHVLIFTVPVRMAVQMGIRMIVWGENSQNEYGGPATAAENPTLDRRWLEEFGGLLGLRVSDLLDGQGITPRDLIAYKYPSDDDLRRSGVTGLFLGYFQPWDGYQNALVAQANGFETYPKCIEGSLVNYENLDNHQTGIHDYFKFLKYGFGRATDLACMHIRRGRLARAEAVQLVRAQDGKFPWTYLGMPLQEILEDIDMSTEEFISICDRFTNRKLFETDGRGNLKKDRHGNLTKLNYDNP